MKYAIMINGVTELAMMKADVLDTFDTIRACTKYKVDGVEQDYMPYDIDGVMIEPVYEDVPGWNTDLTGLSSFEDAPEALKNYVKYLEQHLQVPVKTVSVGPDRKQTLATR
jgi:adenylosuccinate synthase